MNYKITTTAIIMVLTMLIVSGCFVGKNDPLGVWEAKILKGSNNWRLARLDLREDKTFVYETWEERIHFELNKNIPIDPSRHSGTWEYSSGGIVLTIDAFNIGIEKWREAPVVTPNGNVKKESKNLVFDKGSLVEKSGYRLRYNRVL